MWNTAVKGTSHALQWCTSTTLVEVLNAGACCKQRRDEISTHMGATAEKDKKTEEINEKWKTKVTSMHSH
jgi:hypothetical protein